ncbi:MAG: glycoside hydrolase family 16 protein [Spirochaetales bacterium]|nr:glycoside hydrolase family 16 protein [Spirochaetales bacterium]
MRNKFSYLVIVLSGFVLLNVSSCKTGMDSEINSETSAYPATNEDNFSIDSDKWELVWSDEFDDGIFDENIWDRQILLNPYNNEYQKYTGNKDTAYEENGYMILKASWDGKSYGPGHFTSARVISNPGGYRGDDESDGHLFKYGKIAARIQIPSGKGIWPAFWLLGDNISETGGDTSWPSCGEVDILESGYKDNMDGRFGSGTVGGAIHYDTTVDNKKGKWNYFHDKSILDEGLYGDEFHVYELEWSESNMSLIIDGVPYFSKDISDPSFNEFRADFYVIFNIAVGGNLTDIPDNTTVFPKYMYIDWIRHYQVK